jgi:hypothetical protein
MIVSAAEGNDRPEQNPSFGAELDWLGVAAAAGNGKPWIAFARQKLARSGFDECSNHLQ